MDKKSIREIEEEFKQTTGNRNALYLRYADDDRAGVIRLIAKYRKQDEKCKKEQDRLEAMCCYEKEYSSYGIVCGIDEAGRGPLAGPVVAGAVILPKDCRILYLNDSKQLSAKRRECLYDEIMEKAISVGVGMASPARIDEINILQATYEAMRKAIGNLNCVPDVLLNDAVTIPEVSIRQVPIIKGDAKSLSIAAASVIAKTERDAIMESLALDYPAYNWQANKGYPTRDHYAAIAANGVTPLHRRSFRLWR